MLPELACAGLPDDPNLELESYESTCAALRCAAAEADAAIAAEDARKPRYSRVGHQLRASLTLERFLAQLEGTCDYLQHPYHMDLGRNVTVERVARRLRNLGWTDLPRYNPEQPILTRGAYRVTVTLTTDGVSADFGSMPPVEGAADRPDAA